jgi:dihydrofolate synthase/folylpolyglutamate synthase
VAAVERALARQRTALTHEAARVGLGNTALPGRLTTVRLDDGPLVVLDGAHNALAAEALSGAVAALKADHAIRHTRLVVGMVGGHAPEGVLAALAPGTEMIVACQPDWKRAQPAEAIADAARAYTRDVRTIARIDDAVRFVLQDAGPDTLVLITGSFYTVGEVPLDRLAQWWAEMRAPH